MFWLVAAPLILMTATLAAPVSLHAGTGRVAANRPPLRVAGPVARPGRDFAHDTLDVTPCKTVRHSNRARLVLRAVIVFSLLAAAIPSARAASPDGPFLPPSERLPMKVDLFDARTRPAQAAGATALPEPTDDRAPLEPAESLRDLLTGNPEKPKAPRILSRNEVRLGNSASVPQNQARRVAQPKARADATDWADVAERMIRAAGGYVSPEAEDALIRAIALDPRNRRARYYAGLATAQNGLPDVAYRIWSGLLSDRAIGDPWWPLIHGQVHTVARAAGVPADDPGLRHTPVAHAEDTSEVTR